MPDASSFRDLSFYADDVIQTAKLAALHGLSGKFKRLHAHLETLGNDSAQQERVRTAEKLEQTLKERRHGLKGGDDLPFDLLEAFSYDSNGLFGLMSPEFVGNVVRNLKSDAQCGMPNKIIFAARAVLQADNPESRTAFLGAFLGAFLERDAHTRQAVLGEVDRLEKLQALDGGVKKFLTEIPTAKTFQMVLAL